MASLNFGLQCIKYLLCIFNFFFVMVGILMIATSTSLFSKHEDFSDAFSSGYFLLATFLMTFGAFIFIIAFFGYFGTLTETTGIIRTFAYFQSIMLVLEFLIVVACYFLRDNLMNFMNHEVNHMMQHYKERREARVTIDFLQSQLHCCGFNGAQDWVGSSVNTNNPSSVPDSCCVTYGVPHQDCTNIYEHGCYDSMAQLESRSAFGLMVDSLIIGLIQIFEIIFASLLIRAIARQKIEEAPY